MLLLLLVLQAISSIFGAIDTTHCPKTAVTPAFFGLTVLDFEHINITVPYGTARAWDAFGVDWSDINHDGRGLFYYGPIDAFVPYCKGRDIIFNLARTPQWASSNPNNNNNQCVTGLGQCSIPTQLTDWDAWVRAIVTHSKTSVKYWENWNEPNAGTQYWDGTPAQLATLAMRAYPIIKSIDSTAKVLSPPTTTDAGFNYFKSFLAAGGVKTFDVVAFHGYTYNDQPEDIAALVAGYRSIMSQYNISTLPLWDTEISYIGDGTQTVSQPPDINIKAGWLVKSYLLHWSLGVERCVWYAWDQSGTLYDPKQGLLLTGMAFNAVYNWLVGAVMTRPCQVDSQGTYTCGVSRSGGYYGLIAWNTQKDVLMSINKSFTDYIDVAGNQHAFTTNDVEHPLVNGQIRITTMPIIIEIKPKTGSTLISTNNDTAPADSSTTGNSDVAAPTSSSSTIVITVFMFLLIVMFV